jgi:hypothetical protein
MREYQDVVYCPSCGKQAPENVSFCPSCGFNLKTGPAAVPSSQAPSASPSPAPVVSQPAKVSHTARNVGIVVLAIVLVIAALAVIGTLASGGGGIVPQQHTENIVNGLITVGGDSYNDYQFSVPSGASGGGVSGSFSASGGSGNDIEVIIMDSTNFVNWQNGHSYNYYYDSGQETTGTISANLPAGTTYYLVYSNTFSLLSSKNVQTTVNLSYTS